MTDQVAIDGNAPHAMHTRYGQMHNRKPETWRPVKNGDLNKAALMVPVKWCCQRTPRIVTVDGDIFDGRLPFSKIDLIFAVMASSGGHNFLVSTKCPKNMRAYFYRVAMESVMAAVEYEARMRAHFEKHKSTFTEGYSLPGAPTPEVRFIYDSAAIQEGGDITRGTGHFGFSGQEYHWRKWPLDNVFNAEGSALLWSKEAPNAPTE